MFPALPIPIQIQVKNAREKALAAKQSKLAAANRMIEASDLLVARVQRNNFHIKLERAITGNTKKQRKI